MSNVSKDAMITLVEIHADWPRQLDRGLEDLGLDLGSAQREALIGYLGLLVRWNRAYNLSAVRDPDMMVRRHLLDSLSILPWVDRGPVLDVGTGAGLPGIPLAIARPALNFSLLDSNSKKTRFVQQVVGELGLANVEVIRSRVENLDRPQHYALIVARAFASLGDLFAATAALLAPGGSCLAMKGVQPQDELGELPAGLETQTVPLCVPGEAGRRHLVIIRQRSSDAPRA
jgi:16S rRNA (guanine527-N7)-methyltransferase